MAQIVLLFCLAVFVSAANGQPPQVQDARSIEVRVRLRTMKAAEILVSGENLKIGDHDFATQTLAVIPKDAGWVVRPRQGSEIRFSVPSIEIQGQHLNVDHRSVPQVIHLSRRESQVDVIASLSVERYIEGVLPSEMPVSWPLEALKAQAIAARTFAIAKIHDRMQAGYHLDASVLDQVYRFERTAVASPRAVAAVHATESMVLLGENNKPIEAYFHSDCGGRTERATDVWGTTSDVAEGNEIDESCALTTKNEWSYKISLFELAARLRLSLHFSPQARILALDVLERSASGRAKRLSLRVTSPAEGNQSREFTGQELRAMLGFEKVKSTLFQVRNQGGDLAFTGKGFGHGVGLCQHGARHMAESGYGAEAILLHYYPQAHLSGRAPGFRQPSKSLTEQPRVLLQQRTALRL